MEVRIALARKLLVRLNAKARDVVLNSLMPFDNSRSHRLRPGEGTRTSAPNAVSDSKPNIYS